MSIPLPPSMTSKSKPVRMLFAVAGSATILAGGLPLLTPHKFDWIGPAVGLLGLVISGGVTIYTEQNTTPWEDVAVKATPTGKLVAGPAAENLPNGAAVKVQGVAGQVVPGSATIASAAPVETVAPEEGDTL
jgi:hypothetical protein